MTDTVTRREANAFTWIEAIAEMMTEGSCMRLDATGFAIDKMNEVVSGYRRTTADFETSRDNLALAVSVLEWIGSNSLHGDECPPGYCDCNENAARDVVTKIRASEGKADD